MVKYNSNVPNKLLWKNKSLILGSQQHVILYIYSGLNMASANLRNCYVNVYPQDKQL